MINKGKEDGTFCKAESDIMSRLINFKEVQVGTIMTSRKEMTCWDIKDSMKKHQESIQNHYFNYFPVIDGSVEKLLGLVSVRKIAVSMQGGKVDVLRLSEAPIYVPELANNHRSARHL